VFKGSRLLLAFAPVLLAGGCATAPPADPRPVVDSFRECLTTYYEQREAAPARPSKALLDRRARAGARLIAELSRQGLRVPEDEARRGLAGVAPHVERFIHTRTELAFAEIEPAAGTFPGSFLVADG